MSRGYSSHFIVTGWKTCTFPQMDPLRLRTFNKTVAFTVFFLSFSTIYFRFPFHHKVWTLMSHLRHYQFQCNTVGGKKGEKRKKPVWKNEVQSSLNTTQLKASFFFFLFLWQPLAIVISRSQTHRVFKICITKPFTSIKWGNKQTHFSLFNFLLLNRRQRICQVLSNQHWRILHINY